MAEVIRVKSYCGEDPIKFGTGVIITPNYVLTAGHVVVGERHAVLVNGVRIDAVLEQKNEIAALLKTEKILPMEKETAKYTTEEILSNDTQWSVKGFITDEQIEHSMVGRGVVYLDIEDDNGADYQLQNIECGYSENYEGLSGAPVMCHNRIVGILQVQNFSERGILGVSMTSVGKFCNILPGEVLSTSEYWERFSKRAKEFTKNIIDKNILSKKYIPEIFVEEGTYKENLRYFSQPDLFINKVIEELDSFCLKEELSFSDIPQYAYEHTAMETCDLLISRLSRAIRQLDDARKKNSSSGKSLEKQYLEESRQRYGLKSEFERILEELSFFKYQIILITKGAGRGKTNFLCDFAVNFLLKKGLPVLFYNAYNFREPIMSLIKKELTLDSKYEWKYVQRIFENRWKEKHVSLTVIIDGLNENIALNDFEGYVVDFLKEIQKLPYIKVVLSTREELLQERFEKLNADEIGPEFYQMKMKYLSEAFKDRIFQGYLKYFDMSIMKDTLWDESYQMLTQNMLLLRFFCEVNRGKKQIRMLHVYKYNLFSKYDQMKCQEISRNDPAKQELYKKLVDHICKYMIENKSFSNIPRRELSEQELTIFDQLLENDVLFKQEMECKTGFLKENEIVLSFTFDEFRDFCLTRYILTHDIKNFRAIWNQMHSEEWIVLEGVERYIFFLSRTVGKEILPFLQQEESYAGMYWDNVWELEEKDIEEKDIGKWQDELLVNGEHAADIVSFLLHHSEKEDFPKLNVELLFKMFNQLAENLEMFHIVTERLFGKKQKDRYEEFQAEQPMLPCEVVTKEFMEHSEEEDFIKRNKHILQLSIYMVEIDAYQLEDMWVKIYLTTPEVVKNIFDIYLKEQELPPLIYQNLERIFRGIYMKCGRNQKLECIKQQLDKKVYRYDYSAINADLKSIFEF